MKKLASVFVLAGAVVVPAVPADAACTNSTADRYVVTVPTNTSTFAGAGCSPTTAVLTVVNSSPNTIGYWVRATYHTGGTFSPCPPAIRFRDAFTPTAISCFNSIGPGGYEVAIVDLTVVPSADVVLALDWDCASCTTGQPLEVELELIAPGCEPRKLQLVSESCR